MGWWWRWVGGREVGGGAAAAACKRGAGGGGREGGAEGGGRRGVGVLPARVAPAARLGTDCGGRRGPTGACILGRRGRVQRGRVGVSRIGVGVGGAKTTDPAARRAAYPNGVCKIAGSHTPHTAAPRCRCRVRRRGGTRKEKNEGGPRSSRGQRDASATWPSDGVCTPAHFLFCCTYSTYLQSCCVRLVRGPVRLDHDRFPHASDSSVCSGFCDGRALQCVIVYMHDHAVPGPADSKTEQKKRSAEAHGTGTASRIQQEGNT